MKIILNTKSVTVVVIAASLCTATGYLIYALLKRDDKDDEDFKTVKKQSLKLSTDVELKIPVKFVGALIGRNGNHIKSIEDQTKTAIRFQENKDNDYRLCIIRGSKEACNDAQSVIKEFINNQPKLESEEIEVPQSFVPKIIGRCGEEITEIIARSGAKIVISNNFKGPTRKISITGSKEQIEIAKANIQQIIERCQIAQDYLEVTLAKREPRLKSPSPRLEESEKQQTERSPSPNLIPNSQVESLSPLLGKSDTQYVYVSALENPSQFWIQIVGTKAAELDKLVEKMTDFYNNEEWRKSHSLNSVQIGDRIAAIFECDQKWYRAEVVGLPTEEEPSVELFYVDYGDYNIVPLNEVCSLPTDFLELNFQAIECCLSKIEPVGGKWSDEAIDLFEELAQVAKWRKLVAVLDNYSEQPKEDGSPVPGISLYDNSGCQNIAEALVNNGYAVFKEQRTHNGHNGNASSHSDNESIEVNK